LPRIIAFTVLLYEVAINKNILYFYYTAPILLIPLIMLSTRRIMFDLGMVISNYITYTKLLVVVSEREVKQDVWESAFEYDGNKISEEEAVKYMNLYLNLL
jgi:hypothetical protein